MIGLIAPSGNLAGVEPSPHRVRVANDRLWTSGTSNISFTIGQGEALRGLEDETFDRLYYFIFHRIGGKRAALQEAYRVLKPGGRVNIILWVRLVPLAGRSAFSQILDRHLKIALPYRNRRSDRRSDQKELQGLLTEIGFENARTNNDDSSLLFESPEACYAFMRESSYELLPRLPAQLRAEIMAMSSEELEKRRTQVGIKIEIESLVVIAKKPRRVFP